MKTAAGEATAYGGRLEDDAVQRPELEVVMTLTAANLQGRHGANRQGLMPEVTVTAEMPRLVMPTVDVHAVRMVAVSRSDLRVY